MRRALLSLALLAAALPARAIGIGQPQGYWPMARQDSVHSSSATLSLGGAASKGFDKLRLIWVKGLPGSGTKASGMGVSVGADGTVFTSEGGSVYALTPSSGGVVWTSTITPADGFTQPALNDQGSVFVSSSGVVVALSSSTGGLLWRTDILGMSTNLVGSGTPGSAISAFSNEAPLIIDPSNSGGSVGQIYAAARGETVCNNGGTVNSGIAALSASGTKQWALGSTNNSVHQGAVSPSGAIIYFLLGGGVMYSYQTNGTLIGNATLNTPCNAPPNNSFEKVAIDPSGEVYTFCGNSPALCAWPSGLGSATWTATHTYTNIYGLAVDGASSRVYVLADGNLYGYATGTGNTVLNLPIPNMSSSFPGGPLTVAGPNTIYFGQSGNLVDVDPVGGTIRWTFSPGYSGSGVVGSPSQISVSSGVFFARSNFSSGDDFVVAFASADYTGATVSSAPMVMGGSNGLVRTSTVTVTLTGGANIGGVPMLPASVTFNGGNVTPSNAVSYSGLTGNTTYQFTWDFNSIALANWATLNDTVTVQAPGLSAQQMLFQETAASSFTVVTTTPSIEDDGTRVVVVTTITFTVKNSTGGVVPGWPVALNLNGINGGLTKGGLMPPGSAASGFAQTSVRGVTDVTGKAQFNYRYSLGPSGTIDPSWIVPPDFLPKFYASLTAYALSLPAVAYTINDVRPNSYTVAFSTPVVQSDVRATTMTVTVYDASLSTVPNTPVMLNSLPTVNQAYAATFGKYTNLVFGCTGLSSNVVGYTNALGQASFVINLCGGGIDSYTDYFGSAPVFTADIAASTPSFTIESNFLDHYAITAPTGVAVGVSFVSTVTAQNIHSHSLALYSESNVSLVPLFAGTNVQGTGSLGTNLVSFQNAPNSSIPGSVVISSENYNRIENIQIKAVRNTGANTGLSNAINVTGPTAFQISIPTGASAGSVFVATITAVDSSGNQVVGYTGTLALTPVVWNATGTAASGQLSVTNANMPGNGVVTVNESYNAGGGIRIKAFDSALNIVGYSSSMTVTQPALTIDHYAFKVPASITVGNQFAMEIDAQDVSNAGVSYSLDRSINIQALLNGTGVSGSGNLGNSNVTLLAGTTYVIVSPQTYNKIETIQLKVTDQDGKTGTSSAISVTGPTQFVVTMPSASLAGNNFQLIVQAEDATNTTVLGYDGTVSVSALQAANTNLAGAGILNVTNITLAGGVGSTSFESYTKAEGIRFRVADTGIGVSTVTASSMTVLPGPPNSIAFTANPISTIAGVPVALQATVTDLYGNLISGSTVTFSLSNGSGTVSTTYPGVSNLTSTNAVTNASGLAQAFFSSTNTVSSQADLLYASDSGLSAPTTIYNAVLVGAAGGTVVDFSSPTVKCTVPAGAFAVNVRMSLAANSELASSDVALATAAMAQQANTFVSSFTAKITSVLDSSPGTSAGNASSLVTLQFPVNVAGGNVTVGSLHAQNLLVPLSVMRVFKLNQTTNIFEMVLDGTNLPNAGNNTVQVQVKDPNGIYAIGAPPFTPVSSTSSGTVTTSLTSGATAQVSVPFGAFAAPTAIQVTVPQATAVPAVPAGMTAVGSAVTVQTIDGQQPQQPITVQLGYTNAQLGAFAASNFRLARYDAATGWVELQSSVDTTNKQVTGTTNHFSIFQIVAVAPGNDLSTGYVFPNPFRPALGHSNIKFTQLPAGADVKIYAISGRLLQELVADNAGQILSWNGSDKNGRELPSGVYLAVVAANGDKKTLKFAVQR